MNLLEQGGQDRLMSTMKKLRDENNKLRRSGKIDRIVYCVCLSVVLFVAMAKYYGVL